MKAFMGFTAASSSILLLSACASTGTAYEKAPARQGRMVTDSAYVAVVENIARQRGTWVMWVNPPKRRVVDPVASTQ